MLFSLSARAKQDLLRVVRILQVAMPILGRIGFGHLPGLIQRLHDFLRQRTFLQAVQVVLYLGDARNPNDNTIVAVLDLESRVMHRPSQCCLDHGQLVLVDGCLDQLQRLECAFSEISLPIPGSHYAIGVAEAAALGDNVFGLDLAREESAGNGVVHHNIESVAAAGGKQLWLNVASDGVVHALIDCWAHPVVVFARHDDLCNLICGEIAESKAHKLASFVKAIQSLQRLCKWDAPVRLVKIKELV